MLALDGIFPFDLTLGIALRSNNRSQAVSAARISSRGCMSWLRTDSCSPRQAPSWRSERNASGYDAEKDAIAILWSAVISVHDANHADDTVHGIK
jgi:hypothetical protein